MFDLAEYILGGAVLLLVGLSEVAKRRPGVAWLQRFRIERTNFTPAERDRMRRSSTMRTGVQLVLFGIALPLGYLVLTVMMFQDFSRTKGHLVLGGSVLSIVLGIAAIVRSRRP